MQCNGHFVLKEKERERNGKKNDIDKSITGDFFIFIFFIFVFYKNIFLFSKLTEIYSGRLAVERPEPGRPAAGRQRFSAKNFAENLC